MKRHSSKTYDAVADLADTDLFLGWLRSSVVTHPSESIRRTATVEMRTYKISESQWPSMVEFRTGGFFDAIILTGGSESESAGNELGLANKSQEPLRMIRYPGYNKPSNLSATLSSRQKLSTSRYLASVSVIKSSLKPLEGEWKQLIRSS